MTKIECSGCGTATEEYGYCEVDGSPFGECCWGNHVENCEPCKEQMGC